MKKLNLKKWNEKRLEIEDKIMFLDDLIRIPGRGGSSSEYSDLRRLQADATAMYMARAEQRNKLHATIMISYWHDQNADPGNVIDGYSNVMVKVINPVDREYQQKVIADRQDLLGDLYQEFTPPALIEGPAGFANDDVVTEALANRPYPAAVPGMTWDQALKNGE